MVQSATLEAPAVALHPARFVSLELASTITGYSVRAMQTKIDRGVWLDGHEYIRAPDGRILVDIKGYELWAVGQRRAG